MIDSTLDKYLGMFTTFVTSKDEQQNAIYQTALSCAKQEMLTPCFSLLMQLCYQKEIFSDDSILKWIDNQITSFSKQQ